MNSLRKLSHIGNWIFNIAYLNLIWILFTLVGFIFLGLFPATVAMFAIVRKWLILGDREFNIFKTFWSFFRQDFFKINGFALLFYLIGYFLYFNITFLILNPNNFRFLIPGMTIFSLAFLMTILFYFPVFVHFELKFFQYIKQSFLLAVISPMELIGMILSIIIIFGFIVLIPGITPLFTGSGVTICFSYLSKRSFQRLEKKNLEN